MMIRKYNKENQHWENSPLTNEGEKRRESFSHIFSFFQVVSNLVSLEILGFKTLA